MRGTLTNVIKKSPKKLKNGGSSIIKKLKNWRHPKDWRKSWKFTKSD